MSLLPFNYSANVHIIFLDPVKIIEALLSLACMLLLVINSVTIELMRLLLMKRIVSFK